MSRRVAGGVSFILFAALSAHLLYSHLGFNPSDEGYLLSMSRRILDGQVPHRDYISPRPAGSHLLHLHILLWAGDHLIWWSRFIAWCELAVIAWAFLLMAEETFGPFPDRFAGYAVGIIAFTATSSIFPAMPWYTTDGLFFISLGLLLARGGGTGRIAGLLLIGAAPLMKQNYILTVPIIILLLGEGRRVSSWLLVSLPSAAYGLFLIAGGGLIDAVGQMTSHTTLLPWAFLGDRFHDLAISVTAAGAAGGLLAGALTARHRAASAALLMALIVFDILWIPIAAAGFFLGWFSFGLLLGILPFAPRITERREAAIFGGLIIIAAWGSSISEGWPSPSLGAGPVIIFIFHLLSSSLSRRAFRVAVVISLVTALVVFHQGRTERPYGDRPAEDLTYDLTGVFPGMAGIRTNEETFRLLADARAAMDRIISDSPGARPAVVPDFAQFWATSDYPNPLSNDWPADFEIVAPDLRDEIRNEIDEAAEAGEIFLVMKYHPLPLSFGRRPYIDGESFVVDYLRERFDLLGETEYFELRGMEINSREQRG